MIYFDHNASTPLLPSVARLLSERIASAPPGNSSSVHQGGRAARGRLDDARARVARVLGCEPKEICFTGSGSEADALAIQGAFFANSDPRRKRIVSTTIEHPALLGSLDHLRASGAEITLVSPRADGRVAAEDLIAALADDVLLCSLMWANNETGVLQPVREVALACRSKGVLFHSDAVQAVGKVPVTLREADADLLSISAHKFGGPTGVGALVIRRGINVRSLVPGHHENGKRGGSSNVLFDEALALALEESTRTLADTSTRILTVRRSLETEVLRRVPDVVVNGTAERVPNTVNLQFAGADGEALLIALDLEGIQVSAGAACASGSLKPSHVLTAMGLSPKQAHASLRLSLGPTTSEADVRAVVDALERHVPRAREAARKIA